MRLPRKTTRRAQIAHAWTDAHSQALVFVRMLSQGRDVLREREGPGRLAHVRAQFDRLMRGSLMSSVTIPALPLEC
jgi:hypothetical protein